MSYNLPMNVITPYMSKEHCIKKEQNLIKMEELKKSNQIQNSINAAHEFLKEHKPNRKELNKIESTMKIKIEEQKKQINRNIILIRQNTSHLSNDELDELFWSWTL